MKHPFELLYAAALSSGDHSLKNACAGRLRVRVAALVQGSERKGVAVGGGVQLVVDQSDGARGVQLTSWTGQLEHCDRHWTGQLNAHLDWTGI